jgi:hypothetical protein
MKKIINRLLEILNDYEDDITFIQRTLKEIK